MNGRDEGREGCENVKVERWKGGKGEWRPNFVYETHFPCIAGNSLAMAIKP